MSYVNNQWSFPYPDCPSCCLIRAKQGFPMPGAFGDYCPPCVLQRKLDAYHQSAEYLAWRALLDAFQAAAADDPNAPNDLEAWYAANPQPPVPS